MIEIEGMENPESAIPKLNKNLVAANKYIKHQNDEINRLTAEIADLDIANAKLRNENRKIRNNTFRIASQVNDLMGGFLGNISSLLLDGARLSQELEDEHGEIFIQLNRALWDAYHLSDDHYTMYWHDIIDRLEAEE